MNVKNVKKREILDYKQFLGVTADPFNKKNLSKEDRTGFHKIKPVWSPIITMVYFLHPCIEGRLSRDD